MATVSCPHCQHELEVELQSVPQELQCPACGGEFEAPATSNESAPKRPTLLTQAPLINSSPVSDNPYASPGADVVASPIDPPIFHTGIGRVTFAFMLLAAAILPIAFALFAFSGKMTSIMAMIAVIVVMVLLVLYPFAKRLENIGYPTSYCFLAFVPVVSFFLMLACLVLPSGFAHHRQIDPPGLVVFVLVVGLTCWGLIAA